MQKSSQIPVLKSSVVFEKLLARNDKAVTSYRAMYSSWLGGITTEPGLMVVPIDDHQVHRGDAVFEALKLVYGKIFLWQPHIERLRNSAQKIGMQIPYSDLELAEIAKATVQASGLKNALLRLYCSRGPGGFSTNPYESVGVQIYLVVTELVPVPETKYQDGVRIGRSQIPVKEGWFAQIKSCNYLHNVLMKKEAVDRNLDFTVGFDQHRTLSEGSTENIVVLTEHRELVHPPLSGILAGTTMARVWEIAEREKQELNLKSISARQISEDEILKAQEVMMVGTTLDCLPVGTYEGHKIGDGTFSLCQFLRTELLKDQEEGSKSLCCL